MPAGTAPSGVAFHEVADGSSMAYREFGDGSGPPVVLVPGLTDGLAPLHEEAGAAAVDPPPRGFPERRVVVVSCREPMPSPWSTQDMAGDVADFLDAVVGGPAVIVGHSMGAMIAQHLAADRPDLVDRLVLSSTVASPDRVFVGHLLRWESLLRTGAWRAFYRDAADVSFSGRRRLVERLRLRLTPVRRPSDALVRRHLVLSAACRTHDAAERLPEVRAPALVLVGERDGLTRPVRAQELAGAIGAKFVVVPGAAHALPEQRSDGYARRVREFLDGGR